MKQKTLFFFFLTFFYMQNFYSFAVNDTQKQTKADKIIETLQKAIQEYPSAALYCALGNAYSYQKRAETIHKDPSDLEGHQKQAITLGIETYQKGISLFPNSSELYCGLGNLYFGINHDTDTAISTLKTGIEICPSANLYAVLIDIYRYGLNDTKLAIQTCKFALKKYNNLNLYLALGEHSSFLSRSRISHSEKINHKKEALNAYQNALHLNPIDIIYKKIIISIITLYAELSDIYVLYYPNSKKDILEFQHEVIRNFEIAKQLDNCIINEKLREKIQYINDNLEKIEETDYNNNEKNLILSTSDDIILTETTQETEFIQKKDSPPLHTQILNDETLQERNIFWGDIIESKKETDQNNPIDFLNDAERAYNYFCELVNDFKNNPEYIRIRKDVTPKIQICNNYLNKKNLKEFYYELARIYYSYLAQNEKESHKKTKFLEKCIDIFNDLSLSNDFVFIKKIEEIAPFYYYALGNIYNFELVESEENYFTKISYIKKSIKAYKKAITFSNFEYNKQAIISITQLYYILGKIYNFDLATKEKEIDIKHNYLKKALKNYEKALNTYKKIVHHHDNNHKILKKIKNAIKFLKKKI